MAYVKETVRTVLRLLVNPPADDNHPLVAHHRGYRWPSLPVLCREPALFLLLLPKEVRDVCEHRLVLAVALAILLPTAARAPTIL
jgi:hypothetical protein